MLSYRFKTPGVYTEETSAPPRVEFLTGVPAFLGYTNGPVGTPVSLTLWSKFLETFGAPKSDGYLADAVQGFFQNGGKKCYVIGLDNERESVTALQEGLAGLQELDTIDLICAPDIMAGSDQPVKQKLVLDHCDKQNDRFAILDSLPSVFVQDVLSQRTELIGQNGALYFPWLRVYALKADGQLEVGKGRFVPPCGHVAGVYSRSDYQLGPFKAPANEPLDGVMDLKISLTNSDQDRLNESGINCLRAFAGRGIRIWGARTLSNEPTPGYVSVRRLMITVSRWIERFMLEITFEENNFMLWMRIERELTAYLDSLFRAGALKGNSPQQGFYVKCNEETNPAEVREAGKVVTEVGIAPALPSEFIVVRITHSSDGVSIT